MKNLVLKNGLVYDPINGIRGERCDLHIVDGRLTDKLDKSAKTLDCSGMIVLPSGVDIHTHCCGSIVNSARMMRPESFGAGNPPVPTTRATGRLYSQLGYTHVNESAVAPLYAIHMHHEFNHTPCVDKTGLVLVGNNHQLMEYISGGEQDKAIAWLAYLLSKTKTYGIKAVNPGGYIAWENSGDIKRLDDEIPGYAITPADVISSLVNAQNSLGLPHPLHLHLNNIGRPGSWETALETLKLDLKMHVTHLQFSCYGGEGWRDMDSRADELARQLNKNKNVTVDMGQVVFGETTTLTADAPFEHYLGMISHGRWSNVDVENEAGGGVVPYNYRRKNPVNAIQWACGLELALLVDDPWKISLSTDHPNAGLFRDYPKIIAWLMDKKQRLGELNKCHPAAREKTTLESLSRELTLEEIVIMTRAGPAKRLGLDYSLGVGCPANISVYDLDPDAADGEQIIRAFSKAKYTIKDGVIVYGNDLTRDVEGKTIYVKPRQDVDLTDDLRKRFKYYSVNEINYGVKQEHIQRGGEVVL